MELLQVRVDRVTQRISQMQRPVAVQVDTNDLAEPTIRPLRQHVEANAHGPVRIRREDAPP